MAVLMMMIVFAGCQKKQEATPFVNPPFDQLDIANEKFSVDNSKSDTLELASGTRIMIPAGAFADSTGTPVEGEVTVRYREFHDALGILISGIPMDIQTGDRRSHLQTAGMFEIRASQGANNLQMSPDQTIRIDMASRTAGEGYNFFGFDEQTGEWDFLGYPETSNNPEYTNTQERIEKLGNTLKFPLGPRYFIFDYTGALDVYYNMGREINNREEVMEKVSRYGIQWLAVYTRQMITFEGNEHLAGLMLWKALSGKPFPEWVKQRGYLNAQVDHQYGNVYRLKVRKKGKKNFETPIECIMPLRSLFAFSPSYWENNYEEAMKKMRKEEARLRTQAKVFRTFEINTLGIANFDCLYKQEDPIEVKASFELTESYDNEIYNLDHVFCLPGNNKTVINLTPRNWDRLWLDARDTNFRLITVLPGNRLGMYPLEKYRTLNFDSLRMAENPEITFELEPLSGTIGSRKKLAELLGFE
jgi:hypothetical protein